MGRRTNIQIAKDFYAADKERRICQAVLNLKDDLPGDVKYIELWQLFGVHSRYIDELKQLHKLP